MAAEVRKGTTITEIKDTDTHQPFVLRGRNSLCYENSETIAIAFLWHFYVYYITFDAFIQSDLKKEMLQ